jgi:hypothetical protein
LDARLTALLVALKSKEVKTGCNLPESSKEANVLPMMMMMKVPYILIKTLHRTLF